MGRSGQTFRSLCVLGALAPHISVLRSHALDWSKAEVGARTGLSASKGNFQQSEAFSKWNIHQWPVSTNFLVIPRLETTAGYLESRGKFGFIGTVGPEFVFEYRPVHLELDSGFRATVISREHYESREFGIPFQFTTHIGVNWEFVPNWRMGYRYEHMSNAGLSSSNPGLNMHLLGLSYQF